MHKQQYQAYAAATQTAPKTKQILMLYDGVIRLLQQAREAIRENRIENRYRALARATDIIMGLQGCLDFENGGDVARVLYNFYSTIDSRIFSIHRSNSTETCDEVIAEMKKMRSAWQEVDQSMASSTEADKPAAATEGDGSASDSPDQNLTLSA